MCNPALAIMGVSTALSVAGSMQAARGAQQQAEAAAQNARYQQQIAENNQKAAERSALDAELASLEADEAAADARRRGEIERVDYSRQARQLSARQRAVLASNGVDLGSGSVIDVLGDTAALGKRDALQIRSNAEREAQQYESEARGLRTTAANYETQGANFQNEASLYQNSGRNAIQAGNTRAQSALFGGATSVAKSWYSFGDERGWFDPTPVGDPNFGAGKGVRGGTRS